MIITSYISGSIKEVNYLCFANFSTFATERQIMRYCWSNPTDFRKNLDQASQICGGSLWVKLNCHIFATPVYVNGKIVIMAVVNVLNSLPIIAGFKFDTDTW